MTVDSSPVTSHWSIITVRHKLLQRCYFTVDRTETPSAVEIFRIYDIIS